MITPILDVSEKKPLYEQLYDYIRMQIGAGVIISGEKLPSKRKLAAHINISQSTVENAYAQLIAEGYIESKPKCGYFVCRIDPLETAPMLSVRNGTDEANIKAEDYRPQKPCLFDLNTDAVDTKHFPFSVWNKLLRDGIRDSGETLLAPIHPQGNFDLRQEIVRYLRAFRGMDVDADQVVLGAGMEYLLGILTELLPNAGFACENPGYQKMPKLLTSRNLSVYPIRLDAEGLCVNALLETKANVVLTTPSRHFPLGITMSISRRQQLLQWAREREDRYLIEDDFDSEFRYLLKPIPTLHSLDRSTSKVIYMNSFAKTLTPSLRIAYMVLPKNLLRRYEKTLSFYSCTVSEFEQRIICSFLKGGYYERHLNRMRIVYRKRRDAFVEGLLPIKNQLTISGQEAGLHLLIKMPKMKEADLAAAAEKNGILVYPLSSYYWNAGAESNTVIAGYAGYPTKQLAEAAKLLVEAWQ